MEIARELFLRRYLFWSVFREFVGFLSSGVSPLVDLARSLVPASRPTL